MTTLLSELEASGALSALDVELARALGRLGGEAHERVLLAAAFTSRALRDGHVCSDLPRLARSELCNDEGEGTGHYFPQYEELARELTRSPLVGSAATSGHPLVLDGEGRLYLARYFDHEQWVAAHLERLARSEHTPPPLNDSVLAALFPPKAGVDLQREAALTARTRGLSMIVGGPGTGKTTTVVRLLALLVADALSAQKPAPRALLVAPTGKAAQRLSESIRKALATLPVDPAIRAAIPTEARTIHRALKAQPDSSVHFQHGRHNRLACDVVLLDEASMVDLALMRRLLDALPDHARFIILGDPDQLSSVEAGGVLFDLCQAASQPDSPLAVCLSRLKESHRYHAESGIARLARAVQTNALDDMLRTLAAGLPDVVHRPPYVPGLPRKTALLAHAHKSYAGLNSAELEQRIAALDHFRVLTAHRRGPVSVSELNPALARAVHGDARLSGANYPGRPVIILQNDYSSGLFNGDVGVLHPARRRGPLCAYFRDEAGALRELSCSRLPEHESVYATTIHKSQGSEFAEVVIALPSKPSPVLSRELLFTAITRARHKVTLYASPELLRAALTRSVMRMSGLSARLVAGAVKPTQ